MIFSPHSVGCIYCTDIILCVTSCSNTDFLVEIGKEAVSVALAYFRPTQVELLIGDPAKAIEKSGWRIKYDLKMLVNDMVTSNITLFQKERVLKELGYVIKNQYE